MDHNKHSIKDQDQTPQLWGYEQAFYLKIRIKIEN